MRMENKCCLCNNKFKGYGNNPYPLSDWGVCCDKCNGDVITYRMYKLSIESRNDQS